MLFRSRSRSDEAIYGRYVRNNNYGEDEIEVTNQGMQESAHDFILRRRVPCVVPAAGSIFTLRVESEYA